MSLSGKFRRAPLRLASGAFVLNTGIGKLSADEQTAKQLHGTAIGTYPFLEKVQPKLFVKGLAVGEITVGSALLLPFVSPVVAGAALVGFSGALLNMYWRTPGMHEEGNPRPTRDGMAIAKDVWLFGMGAGLITDAVLEPAHDKKVELSATVQEKRNRKAKRSRKARKAAKNARAEAKAHAVEVARETQAEFSKRARETAKKAAKNAKRSDALKRAQDASDRAAKRLADVRDEYGPVAAEKAKDAAATARSAIEEYGPVAAEKAKQAGEAVRDFAGEYGPVAAEKAKHAVDATRGTVDEYGPVVAKQSRRARRAAHGAAHEAAQRAQAAGERARERIAG